MEMRRGLPKEELSDLYFCGIQGAYSLTFFVETCQEANSCTLGEPSATEKALHDLKMTLRKNDSRAVRDPWRRGQYALSLLGIPRGRDSRGKRTPGHDPGLGAVNKAATDDRTSRPPPTSAGRCRGFIELNEANHIF